MKSQSFWDHIQELRSRLLKAIIGLILTTILAFFYWDEIWAIMSRPITKGKLPVGFIATSPMESVMTSLKMSLLTGLILAFPWIIWQLWRFLAPALYKHERSLFLGTFFGAIIMFLSGGAFCYFVVLPMGLAFLATYGAGNITQNWKQAEFSSFVAQFLLAFGAIFEFPVVAFVLARLGLITAKGMWGFFRYAVVLIFIVAALLTPGPDPISQLLMAMPLIFLYILSIGLCALAQKKREATLEEGDLNPMPKTQLKGVQGAE